MLYRKAHCDYYYHFSSNKCLFDVLLILKTTHLEIWNNGILGSFTPKISQNVSVLPESISFESHHCTECVCSWVCVSDGITLVMWICSVCLLCVDCVDGPLWDQCQDQSESPTKQTACGYTGSQLLNYFCLSVCVSVYISLHNWIFNVFLK